MSRRVIIRPRAERDLQEAWSWYEARRVGLGEQFLREIRSAIHFLEKHPERRQLYYLQFRRVLTARFPYKIFYTFKDDRVTVFGFCMRSAITAASFSSPLYGCILP